MRFRSRRRRRKVGLPAVEAGTPQYSAREVALLAQVPLPTLKRWLRRGWLPPVRFLGRYTRYGPQHVYLAKILPWVENLPRHPRFLEIAEILAGTPPPGAPPRAVPVSEAPPPPPPPAPSEKIPLGPGLNLELTAEASPLMRALAEAIVRQVKG